MRVFVSFALLALATGTVSATAQSCFGRGLLLFRAGVATLVEKDDFLLQEPTAGAH